MFNRPNIIKEVTSMKVAVLSKSDSVGGAAIACFRMFTALLDAGVDATLIVDDKASGHHRVITVSKTKLSSELSRYRKAIDPMLSILHSGARAGSDLSSFNVLPRRRLVSYLNENFDIVHLHWVNANMLSICDIQRIQRPVVWTFHDMWPLLASEHYTSFEHAIHAFDRTRQSQTYRWLDRLTFARKSVMFRRLKNRRGIRVISPSNWLSDLVTRQGVCSQNHVEVVPNCLNTDLWYPHDKAFCRHLYGLSDAKTYVLFAAFGGERDPRKGGDLLIEALKQASLKSARHVELIIVGGTKGVEENFAGTDFRAHKFGNIADERALALLFAAADIAVIPSRLDNLPNIGLEAQASGLPIVAFNVGGISDIVTHRKNGVLVAPHNISSLSDGIALLANDTELRVRFGNAARASAIERYSFRGSAAAHIRIYQSMLRDFEKNHVRVG